MAVLLYESPGVQTTVVLDAACSVVLDAIDLPI